MVSHRFYRYICIKMDKQFKNLYIRVNVQLDSHYLKIKEDQDVKEMGFITLKGLFCDL